MLGQTLTWRLGTNGLSRCTQVSWCSLVLETPIALSSFVLFSCYSNTVVVDMSVLIGLEKKVIYSRDPVIKLHTPSSTSLSVAILMMITARDS